MEKKLFTELGLAPELLKAVERMGYEEASPIQSATIPLLLAGRDIIGQSQTGSGKTAAFGIPAVQLVDPAIRAPQVIVLCPTRELAVQVAEEMAKIAFFKRGVKEVPIFGGQSYERQFRALAAGPQIVIGTPGRVIDHLDRGTLKLDAVKMVILDEGDRMLDMGFREDIERILETVPKERQTVIFSATMPAPIKRIIERATREPEHVRIEGTAMTIPAIDQSFIEVDWRSKTEVLCRLLDLHDVKFSIVFGFTKAQVDEICETLQARGYNADRLHGDMTQPMRDRTMRRFRDKKIEILVATDVAARGLDVDDLEIVFNYELPHDPEDYVHRIGRTGRAGKSGRAITLVGRREFGRMQSVMRFTKAKIRRDPVPKVSDLEERGAARLFDTLRSTIEGGEFARNDALLAQLLDAGHSPNDVAFAAIHLLSDKNSRTPERIAEDEPQRGYRDRPQYEQRGGDRQERPDRPQRRERPPRDEFTEEPGTLDAWADDQRRGPAARRPAPRGDFGAQSHEPGMVRLSFNLGREARVMPGDFVGCIAGVAGIPREQIGAIAIMPDHTFVDIAEESVPLVLKKMRGVRLKGHPIFVEPATERPQGNWRKPRRDFRDDRR